MVCKARAWDLGCWAFTVLGFTRSRLRFVEFSGFGVEGSWGLCGLRVQGLYLIGCKTQLFNFWGSYKVLDSESFNFYSLGFWASKIQGP